MHLTFTWLVVSLLPVPAPPVAWRYRAPSKVSAGRALFAQLAFILTEGEPNRGYVSGFVQERCGVQHL